MRKIMRAHNRIIQRSIDNITVMSVLRECCSLRGMEIRLSRCLQQQLAFVEFGSINMVKVRDNIYIYIYIMLRLGYRTCYPHLEGK